MKGLISVQDYIDFLQRFIIVHSYIYYELNNNVISDKYYDEKAKELTKLKTEYPELWKQSMYYEQFGDDYNGATGFTLYYNLNEHQKEIIRAIARSLLSGFATISHSVMRERA